jgi:hypothetical protein
MLDGTTCPCEHSQYEEAYVECSLPPLCSGAYRLCGMQALRYGVPGSLSVVGPAGDEDHHSIEVEILGAGQARALEHRQTHTCCGGATVESSYVEGFPTTIRSAEDPAWTECLEIALGFEPRIDCYAATNFGAGTCDEALTMCPDIEPHVPGCDDACPMAGDGVCDEPSGTGLCAVGCDSIDCTCAEDVPGRCDESFGSACPPGADADDCA